MSGTWPADLDDLERALLTSLSSLEAGTRGGPLAPGSSLTVTDLDGVFDAQLASRHLDHTARWLRSTGRGFYTIGSAGHEANALVAAALRPTDPALLHYRSGGFYLARAQQVEGHDGVRDVLLGLLAAADEPIAGGRHKVFGHPDLAVVPQTSTIASHLPRAMGVAFAIGRARRLGLPTRWPERRPRRVQLRRRLAEPLHRAGGAERGDLHGAPGHVDAAAARVRGQRLGDQRADAGRVGRHVVVVAARAALRARRRQRPGRRVRRHRGPRRVGPSERQAGGAAPAHRPLWRTRRHRRGDGLPHGSRDPRRPRPRSVAGDRPRAGRSRVGHARRHRRALPRRAGGRALDGGRARRVPPAWRRRPR